ncbi:hypothetical protein KQP68_03505 [Bacteroides thetaiotaomicron]|uniref:Tip attachment protein J domain-containing protein n=1 Tax=Bacteroides thetaiotaomicron TaxID=818 RepID=A0ABD7U510_BACT4|nr:hypothetical protein [Bacteroides thetaiotaomicron]UYU67361.1 hypothetical protein KQP68_03505 [Bacteroides thetaiotaomicron]
MDAIGLNPIKLDAIGLDPIRMNAIRLGVPGASSGSGRPYIDPELLRHVKMAISTWGKTNDDPDRAVLKDLSGNGNDMRLLNFGFTEGSGYGLPRTDFEGALITDGIDDQIVSTKTIQEMLGGSNDITVVSMIYHINSRLSGGSGYTNYIDNNLPTGQQYFRNKVISQGFGKWGIYGYSSKNNAIPVPITNILGDKADYSSGQSGTYDGLLSSNAKFSPIGRSQIAGSDTSSCAWYWTILADKVLTTDEINQIIAYFNLDRPGQIIKPQLYCNIKKQGITNDNHAEFNDQLVDYINGHNIQLNNIAWEGESGIGKYNVDFDSWIPQFNIADSVHTSNKLCVTRIKNPQAILYTRAKVNSMKVEVKGSQSLELFYQYVDKDDNMILLSLQGDGIYDLPASIASANNYYTGFRVSNYTGECDITITQIPENPDALHLDGISDFGKATGLPVLKDYTICALRKWLYGDSVTSTETGSIVSKSKVGNDGAFILEQTFNRNPSRSSTFSFGTVNSLVSNDKLNEESFTYQTKYSYNGETIVSGSGVDTDSMWLGTIRDGDSRFSNLALWSLMLFPYSLSEFLLERQLKKYEAGTLYPGMIEFRPVIKSNVPYSSVSYSVNPGEYIAEGSTVTITITLSNETDKLVGVSSSAIADISISGDNGVYEVTGKVTKSPQKISIVISSYLTMLGNDTLILNETLIKNE